MVDHLVLYSLSEMLEIRQGFASEILLGDIKFNLLTTAGIFEPQKDPEINSVELGIKELRERQKNLGLIEHLYKLIVVFRPQTGMSSTSTVS